MESIFEPHLVKTHHFVMFGVGGGWQSCDGLSLLSSLFPGAYWGLRLYTWVIRKFEGCICAFVKNA